MFTTLRPVAALLAGVLTATLLTTAPATIQASAQAAETTSSAPVRVGSYNIIASLGFDKFRSGVDRFLGKVDVAGLQEIGTLERAVYLSDTLAPTWGYHRPAEVRQNPVLWRRAEFDLLGAPTNEAHYRIADPQTVENTRGGYEKRSASRATVVRLRHRETGRNISVVNVHLVSGATKSGRAYPGRPKRFRLLKRQVAGTVRLTKAERALGHDVHVVGDFNISFPVDRKFRHRAMPYRKFRKIGFRSMWQGLDLRKQGTRGPGYLDGVWSARRPTSAKVLRRIRVSDHKPAVATYALPGPADGYQPQSGTIGFAASEPVVGDECDAPFRARYAPLVFELEGDLRYGHVGVEVVNGTAVEGKDFTVDRWGLYDADLTRNEIVVTIVTDDKPEPDEVFELRLTDPVHTTITRAVATGVIKDDDRGLSGMPESCKK